MSYLTNSNEPDTTHTRMSPNEESMFDYMGTSALLYPSDHAIDRNGDDNDDALSLFDFEDSVFIDVDTDAHHPHNTHGAPTNSAATQAARAPPLPSVSNYYELDSIQHSMHLGHEALLPPSDDDTDLDDDDDDPSYYQQDDDDDQELSQLYEHAGRNLHNNNARIVSSATLHEHHNLSQQSQESQVQIIFEPIETSPTLHAAVNVHFGDSVLSDPPSPTPLDQDSQQSLTIPIMHLESAQPSASPSSPPTTAAVHKDHGKASFENGLMPSPFSLHPTAANKKDVHALSAHQKMPDTSFSSSSTQSNAQRARDTQHATIHRVRESPHTSTAATTTTQTASSSSQPHSPLTPAQAQAQQDDVTYYQILVNQSSTHSLPRLHAKIDSPYLSHFPKPQWRNGHNGAKRFFMPLPNRRFQLMHHHEIEQVLRKQLSHMCLPDPLNADHYCGVTEAREGKPWAGFGIPGLNHVYVAKSAKYPKHTDGSPILPPGTLGKTAGFVSVHAPKSMISIDESSALGGGAVDEAPDVHQALEKEQHELHDREILERHFDAQVLFAKLDFERLGDHDPFLVARRSGITQQTEREFYFTNRDISQQIEVGFDHLMEFERCNAWLFNVHQQSEGRMIYDTSNGLIHSRSQRDDMHVFAACLATREQRTKRLVEFLDLLHPHAKFYRLCQIDKGRRLIYRVLQMFEPNNAVFIAMLKLVCAKVYEFATVQHGKKISAQDIHFPDALKTILYPPQYRHHKYTFDQLAKSLRDKKEAYKAKYDAFENHPDLDAEDDDDDEDEDAVDDDEVSPRTENGAVGDEDNMDGVDGGAGDEVKKKKKTVLEQLDDGDDDASVIDTQTQTQTDTDKDAAETGPQNDAVPSVRLSKEDKLAQKYEQRINELDKLQSDITRMENQLHYLRELIPPRLASSDALVIFKLLLRNLGSFKHMEDRKLLFKSRLMCCLVSVIVKVGKPNQSEWIECFQQLFTLLGNDLTFVIPGLTRLQQQQQQQQQVKAASTQQQQPQSQQQQQHRQPSPPHQQQHQHQPHRAHGHGGTNSNSKHGNPFADAVVIPQQMTSQELEISSNPNVHERKSLFEGREYVTLTGKHLTQWSMLMASPRIRWELVCDMFIGGDANSQQKLTSLPRFWRAVKEAMFYYPAARFIVHKNPQVKQELYAYWNKLRDRARAQMQQYQQRQQQQQQQQMMRKPSKTEQPQTPLPQKTMSMSTSTSSSPGMFKRSTSSSRSNERDAPSDAAMATAATAPSALKRARSNPDANDAKNDHTNDDSSANGVFQPQQSQQPQRRFNQNVNNNNGNNMLSNNTTLHPYLATQSQSMHHYVHQMKGWLNAFRKNEAKQLEKERQHQINMQKQSKRQLEYEKMLQQRKDLQNEKFKQQFFRQLHKKPAAPASRHSVRVQDHHSSAPKYRIKQKHKRENDTKQEHEQQVLYKHLQSSPKRKIIAVPYHDNSSSSKPQSAPSLSMDASSAATTDDEPNHNASVHSDTPNSVDANLVFQYEAADSSSSHKPNASSSSSAATAARESLLASHAEMNEIARLTEMAELTELTELRGTGSLTDNLSCSSSETGSFLSLGIGVDPFALNKRYYNSIMNEGGMPPSTPKDDSADAATHAQQQQQQQSSSSALVAMDKDDVYNGAYYGSGDKQHRDAQQARDHEKSAALHAILNRDPQSERAASLAHGMQVVEAPRDPRPHLQAQTHEIPASSSSSRRATVSHSRSHDSHRPPQPPPPRHATAATQQHRGNAMQYAPHLISPGDYTKNRYYAQGHQRYNYYQQQQQQQQQQPPMHAAANVASSSSSSRRHRDVHSYEGGGASGGGYRNSNRKSSSAAAARYTDQFDVGYDMELVARDRDGYAMYDQSYGGGGGGSSSKVSKQTTARSRGSAHAHGYDMHKKGKKRAYYSHAPNTNSSTNSNGNKHSGNINGDYYSHAPNTNNSNNSKGKYKNRSERSQNKRGKTSSNNSSSSAYHDHYEETHRERDNRYRNNRDREPEYYAYSNAGGSKPYNYSRKTRR